MCRYLTWCTGVVSTSKVKKTQPSENILAHLFDSSYEGLVRVRVLMLHVLKLHVAPRSLRSLDTRLPLSSIFSLLSLKPWGVRNSWHSWYAIRPWNPRKTDSKKNRFLERRKIYTDWVGKKNKNTK